MDLLSRIGTWLSDHEAMISAVVGIAVLAGIVFAGVRSLLRGQSETSAEKAPGGSAEIPSAPDFSPAEPDSLTVPGFEGRPAIAVLPFDNLSGDPEQGAVLHFIAGRFEDAVDWGQRSLQRRPGYLYGHVTIATSYAHLGRIDEARAALRRALELEPDFSLAAVQTMLSFWDPEDRERYIDGLRKAGPCPKRIYGAGDFREIRG